ncbi:MAG TPA: DUF4013 domain-containing protein, partial [Methanocorpusculum sp.]|nr:DUF4013 domain-containing protein [Methanocorpusculum sp.]
MVGIFENVGASFKFGFRECYGDGFKGFLRMLALFITCIIPIVFFIPMGIFLKVFRGEKPDFTGAGKSFIRGLLSFVIALIYMLIPIILFAIFGGLALIPAMAGGNAGEIGAAILGSIGIIVAIIAAVILGFVAVPAEVNFARNGFGAAFRFSEIFGMISKAGFGKYILSYIVLIIITLIIYFILSLICVIPVIGIIILILVTIPLALFEYKFWA